MTAKTWRIIDWAMPLLAAAVLTIPPQFIDGLKEYPAWVNTVAYVALFIGRVVYRAWQKNRGIRFTH